MSKLQFKELSYFDVTDGGSGDEEERDASDTSDRRSGMSSYELFGLTASIGVSSVGQAAADAEVDEGGRPLTHEKRKKRKKRRKRDSSGDTGIQVVPTSSTSSECSASTAAADNARGNIVILDGHRSSFISKFLSKRRTSHPDLTVPVIEASNARYLQQFLDHFTRDDAARRGGDAVDTLQGERANLFETEAEEEEKDDEQLSVEGEGGSSPEYDPTSFGRNLPSDEVDALFLTHDTSATVPTSSLSLPLEDTTDSCGTVKLQLFNLPYKVSVKEIEEFARRYDCPLEQIVLGLDKKTKAPNGSATAQLTMGSGGGSAQDRIQLLQGERCGGRPVKVLRWRDIPTRRSSGSECGRYFADDISCKCHLCGAVGHRQQDCTNDPLPTPCHLCAGKDHDAGSCPNITCYRCGNFGHHSRDCRNAPMAKAVICTHCGSTTHDIRQCREVELCKVTGPLARCMSCDGWGHTMCTQLPAIRAEEASQQVVVFCPNCGEANHHIDYPGMAFFCALDKTSHSHNQRKRAHESSSFSSMPVKTSCIEPRYDAFNKYPQLLKELSCRESEVDRNQLYRDLLPKYPSRTDLLLFPSLQAGQLQQSRQGGGTGGSSDTVTQRQQSNGRIVVVGGGTGSSVECPNHSTRATATTGAATLSSSMLETVTQRFHHKQHSDRRQVSVEYGSSSSSSFMEVPPSIQQHNNHHRSSSNHGPPINQPYYPPPHHNIVQVTPSMQQHEYYYRNNGPPINQPYYPSPHYNIVQVPPWMQQHNNYHQSSLNHGPPINQPYYPPPRNDVFKTAPPSHAPPQSSSTSRVDELWERKVEARKRRFA